MDQLNQIINKVLEHFMATGLSADIIPDGNWHRAKNDTDKPGETSASYKINIDDTPPSANIKNFKYDTKVFITLDNISLPAAKYAKQQINRKRIQAERIIVQKKPLPSQPKMQHM